MNTSSLNVPTASTECVEESNSRSKKDKMKDLLNLKIANNVYTQKKTMEREKEKAEEEKNQRSQDMKIKMNNMFHLGLHDKLKEEKSQ